MIKIYLRACYDFLKLIIGLVMYFVTNKTMAFAYQALISVFCFTKGYSNDFISKLIGFFQKPYQFSDSKLLRDVNKETRKKILNNLNEDGYHVFEKKLPLDLCDRLIELALNRDCQLRTGDGGVQNELKLSKYQRGKPEAVRYDFRIQDLVDNHDIQNLIADSAFATVAQDYFGSRPVLDIVGMWWTTHFSDKPDKAAAQYYHFDMDRIKWLKFFIYLTDVDASRGPHCYVSGSHKSKALPNSILKKGYARLTDQEVEQAFGKQRIVEFTAPRGTVIVEDTRGLHKGKNIENGDRLILQLQFSNSLFGGYYPKSSFSNDLTQALQDKIKKFPAVYSAYL